jgi:DNA-binding MarR family transcriptional regulator
MNHRYGFELPILLARAFRGLIDQLHAELSQRGHPDARPIHGFALQAIGAEGTTVSELGRRLGVSKQAAAKTAASLESVGYASRVPDPRDARATKLIPTARGTDMLALSAEIFERLRADWVRQLGEARVAALEDDLESVVGSRGPRLGDFPGWLR